MSRISILIIAVAVLILLIVPISHALSVSHVRYHNYASTSIVEKSIRPILKTLTNNIKFPEFGTESNINIRVNWVRYINPTSGYDAAFSTCVWGNLLYVVGTANGTGYIAVLDKNTGNIVRSWRSPPGEVFLFKSCIIKNDRLIVVGINDYAHPVIYVFDKYLDLLAKYVDSGIIVSAPLSISATTDGKYLYLAYWANNSWSLEYDLYIEKRPLYDLGFERSVTISSLLNLGKVGPVTIGVDPSTHQIWLVTWYNFTGLEYDMIFILTPSLYIVKAFNYSALVPLIPTARNYIGSLVGICFDSRGNAYVAGILGLLKFDKYGNLLNVNKNIVGNLKILCIDDKIYLFSVASVGTTFKPVIYVINTNLNLLESKMLSNSRGSIIFFPGKPAYDGKNIYVSAMNYFDDNPDTKIVVYSIYVGGHRPIIRLPDLTVRNIIIEPPHPTTATEVHVKASICNIGNASASNVEYIVKLDSRIVKFGIISELYSHQCVSISANLGKLSPGMHIVRVIVDPFNKIRESNEKNNIATREFYVEKAYTGCKIIIDNATIAINSTKVVNIWLINCSYAASIDLKLQYNPHIIRVINLIPGPFLKAINGLFSKNINNIVGRLAIAMAGTRPCNRNRILIARITILGVSKGVTRFTKVEAKVGDVEGNLYNANVEGGIIKVTHVLECDFNGNGRLDIGDVILLLRILVGTYHSNIPCDLNHNGKLDIGDAVLLLRKIIG